MCARNFFVSMFLLSQRVPKPKLQRHVSTQFESSKDKTEQQIKTKEYYKTYYQKNKSLYQAQYSKIKENYPFREKKQLRKEQLKKLLLQSEFKVICSTLKFESARIKLKITLA